MPVMIGEIETEVIPDPDNSVVGGREAGVGSELTPREIMRIVERAEARQMRLKAD